MEAAHNQSRIGHETRDGSVRGIVITGFAIALVTALVGFITYGIFRYLASRPLSAALPNPMAVTEPQVPPVPRVEEHPQLELQQLRTQEDQTLSTYGWVDKKEGIVRIPIERAMELQLQRGFPVRAAKEWAQ